MANPNNPSHISPIIGHSIDNTGTGVAPPILVPPNAWPGSVMRGNKRAVIASVDSATSPAFATVLIDNHLPGESGYSIPAGWGPFAAGGTSGFNYFYNNSTGTGGSWVLVDADRRMILALDQGVSTTPATPYYKAITDHLHSGNLNPDGYTNPQPVTLSGESQGPLPYTQHAGAVRNVIDPNSNILNMQFPGGLLRSDGSWTSVDGLTSAINYLLYAGQPFYVKASIAKGLIADDAGLILGTTTDGYGIIWGGDGVLRIKSFVGSTITTLTTVTPAASNDTNYHDYRLTVTPGSPNLIEAAFDGSVLNLMDSSLSLT